MGWASHLSNVRGADKRIGLTVTGWQRAAQTPDAALGSVEGEEWTVCGKNGHVLCLKGGIHLSFPQSQDFDKCYPPRIILTCSKLSETVCTFPLGLKVI